MARSAADAFGTPLRACTRSLRRVAAMGLVAGALLAVAPVAALAQGDPVRGEATFASAGGFARMVLKLANPDVATEVQTAGSILVIRFNRPVDIPVDRLGDAVPDYVSAARRDPDGTAIRLSMVRKVTISTMAAGERIFIDMLPEGWSGAAPPLPVEVVRELAERARAAERALRQQRAEQEAKKRPPIRVLALVQPTFVRFVFEMPDGVGASSVLNDQKLTVQFNALLNFDLADAKVAAPPNVASITQKPSGGNTAVEIAMIGDVDVHAFREEKNYIIDVSFQQPKKEEPAADAGRGARPAGKPGGDHAADKSKPGAPEKVSENPPEKPKATVAEAAAEIVPPTSETIARQMKAEPPRIEAPQTAPAEPKAAMQAAPQAPAPVAPASEKTEAPEPAPSAEGGAKPEPARPLEGKPREATAEPPKPVPPPKVAAEPAAAPTMPKEAPAALKVMRDSEGLRLTFSFAGPTAAASFRRGDTVWVVFDSGAPIDPDRIRTEGGAIIGETGRLPLDKGQAIRLRLTRPQLHSLVADENANGAQWTLAIADKMNATPQPLMAIRNMADPALANVAIPLTNASQLHRVVDPEAGDLLMVVTAPPPVRGFIKRQDFVDMSILDSAHGVAVRPNSDDVGVEVAPDKVIIGKPGGLTMSMVGIAAERAPIAVRPLFEIDEWQKNQAAGFTGQEDVLVKAAANAAPDQRAQARLALARFYMSRAMYPEARGIANLMLSDGDPRTDEAVTYMIRAIAGILMGRAEQGLKDLSNPAVGNNYDAQLWKGLGLARQGKWAEAREKFKNVEFAIASLPIDLQRIITLDAMRAAIEVKDFAGASKRRAELDVIGLSPELKADAAVLRGRLNEGLAQDKDALDEYTAAVGSSDREAAADAKQREIALKLRRKEIEPKDALKELEGLAVTWRGDEIELRTLQMLAQLYAEANRYPEALGAARQAAKLAPASEISRQAQDMASQLFADIFLSPKGDELPPVEALGTFYEYQELTPIGRRGDEMIRRLADRLVAIDLLDQAADLLKYQIEKRLQGAARAQVAAKLATIYLTNRKPDRAITALRSTRIADLNGELRTQRLLLEARAQSDIGRHDLGLDIISNIAGKEAVRLRSDIYWAARQWRESAEQIELYYGDRWRDFKPLNPTERSDVLRAAVGYALADDGIGLARFREKFAPLMNGEADKVAFDIASKPSNGSAAEFTQIAKLAASVDTLDGFLREMKARFPETGTRAPQTEGKANPGVDMPEVAGMRRVGEAPASGKATAGGKVASSAGH